jgi:hypothetical protein
MTQLKGGISSIRTNRCASGSFQALIRSSAWNVGDIRGWFQLVLGARAGRDRPLCREFAKKRLMGFEPTTFCMAITPVSGEPKPSIKPICRAFVTD